MCFQRFKTEKNNFFCNGIKERIIIFAYKPSHVTCPNNQIFWFWVFLEKFLLCQTYTKFYLVNCKFEVFEMGWKFQMIQEGSKWFLILSKSISRQKITTKSDFIENKFKNHSFNSVQVKSNRINEICHFWHLIKFSFNRFEKCLFWRTALTVELESKITGKLNGCLSKIDIISTLT